MEIETEVYCRFEDIEDKEKFCSILEAFSTPPTESYYDQSKLVDLFDRLGADISDVKYHVDPEWLIYKLKAHSDTEVVFLFQENNDFSWDKMPAALKVSGCKEVFTKTVTGGGDIFMGLDKSDSSSLIYSTGRDPEIDALFTIDGCFEGGGVLQYIELFRNNRLPNEHSKKESKNHPSWLFTA